MSPMTLYPANPATRTSTLLVLAHGAGAGRSHPFMVRYARGLAERGIDIVTFDFPYMEAGPSTRPEERGSLRARRKTPDRAPVLEDAFRRVVSEAVAHRDVRATRLLIGGKSMGGRMATHLAAAPDAWPGDAPPLDGVIALGYPLRSGKQDRVSHLFKITVPTLIVQGTRDTFGGPDDVQRAIGDRNPLITVYPVNTGDHSFAIVKSGGKTQSQIDQDIWDQIIAWLPPSRTPSAT